MALIVYEIMSGLTLIAQDRAQWFGVDSLDHVWFKIDSSRSWFGIDSLRDCVRFDNNIKVRLSFTWIDTGLRNPDGVGHLLHEKGKNGKDERLERECMKGGKEKG